MKKLIAPMVLVLSSLLIGTLSSGSPAKVVPAKSQFDNKRTLRVGMAGLKQSRLDAAREAIRTVPGVLDVNINVKKKQAEIVFDVERTNLRSLDQSIRNAGFTPWFR